MSKRYIISILVALALLTFPRLIVAEDEFISNTLGVITLFGIVLSPGISFSLFLKRWVKNISDDVIFSSSFFFSIFWIGVASYTSFSQGMSFSRVEIFYWILLATVLLTIAGSIPVKKEQSRGEPFRNRLPAIAIFITLGIFGVYAYGVAVDRYEERQIPVVDNSISVLGQNAEETTIRINNPSTSLMRVTLYFIDIVSAESSEIYTDVLGSGESFINIRLPYKETECRQYQLVYYSSLEGESLSKDVFLNSYGCSSNVDIQPQGALPQSRKDLLEYLYEVGLKSQNSDNIK
jgi:hypothetical protein